MTTNKSAIIKAKTGRLFARLFLIGALVVSMYPVFWNIYSSFKTNEEFLGNPFSLPRGLHFENYINVFTHPQSNIPTNFLNSLYVVGITILVLVVCVIPCAYILARYKFPGSRLIELTFMAAIFIQGAYIMAPVFRIFNTMGWRNMLTPIGVVYAVTQFPFSVFLLTGFMRGIPRDYEEAAMIDGCSNFGILTRVIVPMSKPSIITVGMLSALAAWNEYPLALVLLNQPDKQTLPVGMAIFAEVMTFRTDWGALFAALVIVLIPTIILYAIGQKYLIQGISAGGIKG